ncbi:MAG: hypothetical protein HXY44_05710 [Syntrophaceae bacterium]|nr:hypothetical protein [Syntrophaceae bacterium]
MALKMLIKSLRINKKEIEMRSLLINKNLSLYYWLRRRIGRKVAFKVANTLEKVILIFGREQV